MDSSRNIFVVKATLRGGDVADMANLDNCPNAHVAQYGRTFQKKADRHIEPTKPGPPRESTHSKRVNGQSRICRGLALVHIRRHKHIHLKRECACNVNRVHAT